MLKKITHSIPFTPCWWLPNGHLQTCAPTLLSIKKTHNLQQELIELPDNDILELYWANDKDLSTEAPVILLMHGLEGSIHSPYIQGMLGVIKSQGWRCAVMHLRGSDGRINRIPQSYHAGKTDDLSIVLHYINSRFPNAACAAVGYSLSGNLLLKFLGENPDQTLLTTAVAISVPFNLEATCRHIHVGWNKIYERRFVKRLKYSIAYKLRLHMEMPVTLQELQKIHTLYDFDDQVTAPVHGFKNAQDYYSRCSSLQFLPAIRTPTLIIHAEDDPLIPKAVIPNQRQVSTQVELDIQEYGGHVGFINGGFPGRLHYWLEQRIPAYLRRYFN